MEAACHFETLAHIYSVPPILVPTRAGLSSPQSCSVIFAPITVLFGLVWSGRTFVPVFNSEFLSLYNILCSLLYPFYIIHFFTLPVSAFSLCIFLSGTLSTLCISLSGTLSSLCISLSGNLSTLCISLSGTLSSLCISLAGTRSTLCISYPAPFLPCVSLSGTLSSLCIISSGTASCLFISVLGTLSYLCTSLSSTPFFFLSVIPFIISLFHHNSGWRYFETDFFCVPNYMYVMYVNIFSTELPPV